MFPKDDRNAFKLTECSLKSTECTLNTQSILQVERRQVERRQVADEVERPAAELISPMVEANSPVLEVILHARRDVCRGFGHRMRSKCRPDSDPGHSQPVILKLIMIIMLFVVHSIRFTHLISLCGDSLNATFGR
jgi:hypothetical protein